MARGESRRFGFMLCAALGLALPARAQFDIERFEPALDEEGFLGVQGSRTPGPERASYALFAHYATSLLLVEAPGGDALAVVERRAAGVLSAEAGLGTRVALGLSLPFVLDQRGDKLVTAGPKLPVTLLADPRVHLRYRFVGDASESRTEQRDGPGVALQLSHALPVGDDDGYVGEETLRSELQLIGDMHLLGAGIGASVGIRHRFERARIFNVTLRDELTFGVGLRVPVPPLYPLAGLIELRGATDFESAETTSLEGEVGAVLPLGDFSFVLSGGAGMSGGIGTPAARVILGLWFTPGDPDSDGDGVPNDVDQCPPLPEDRDGFQDDDGCPDPDNDNDLVPDVDDLCPNVEAIEGRDDDEDGCTDKS